MREEYNSILSTPTEADIDISIKPKYRPGDILVDLYTVHAVVALTSKD